MGTSNPFKLVVVPVEPPRRSAVVRLQGPVIKSPGPAYQRQRVARAEDVASCEGTGEQVDVVHGRRDGLGRRDEQGGGVTPRHRAVARERDAAIRYGCVPSCLCNCARDGSYIGRRTSNANAEN